MEETLKAKIRNLLSPSYNLANIIKSERNLDDTDILFTIKNEANIAYESIEEIIKLLEEDENNS